MYKLYLKLETKNDNYICYSFAAISNITEIDENTLNSIMIERFDGFIKNKQICFEDEKDCVDANDWLEIEYMRKILTSTNENKIFRLSLFGNETTRILADQIGFQKKDLIKYVEQNFNAKIVYPPKSYLTFNNEINYARAQDWFDQKYYAEHENIIKNPVLFKIVEVHNYFKIAVWVDSDSCSQYPGFPRYCDTLESYAKILKLSNEEIENKLIEYGAEEIAKSYYAITFCFNKEEEAENTYDWMYSIAIMNKLVGEE